MTVDVFAPAVTQDITFYDSIATLANKNTFCGSKTYTLSPSLSFLTLSGTTLSLNSINLSEISTQTVTVTV